MRKFNVFALLVATLALVTACSNNKANEIDNGAPQNISLKLEQPKPRAIEDPVTAGAVGYQTVTLYYWKDAAGTTASTSIPSRTLSADEISTATTSTDGLKISVPADVVSISMRANTTRVGETLDYAINKIQGLGADFKKLVPMSSPAVAPTTHPNITNAKMVELAPVPDVARLEVVGTITPQPNAEGTNAYKSVTVQEVYINNYKETKDATTLAKRTSDEDWTAHEATMSDKTGVQTGLAGGKAAGYQIFPATAVADEDKLPHVVIKVSYTLADDSVVNDRWITIINYKEGATSLAEFAQGKIYKLNLSALNGLFKTDNDGNHIDNTDPKPEQPKTDLYVSIAAYEWTTVDITPDI
ncbi:MAG: hypothetical protein Q4D93_05800 [Porphyromonas sp.]|nr:hypothetical protein [Porphyromonas sp.]